MRRPRQHHARELGVSAELQRRLVEQRAMLVREVAAAPREWGFDLLPRSAPRRDVVASLRQRTRTQGALAESMLAGYAPLVDLVPDPPTLPDGRSLEQQLQHGGRLDADVAAPLARAIRSELQQLLGRGLDAGALERAAREVAWDHDCDAARLLAVVSDVLDGLA